MGLGAILNGHTNELFGLNKNMSEARLRVCRRCPLYKRSSVLGEVCNSRLWYNPETGDVSDIKRDGYICGCGCRLKAKTSLAGALCPAGKW